MENFLHLKKKKILQHSLNAQISFCFFSLTMHMGGSVKCHQECKAVFIFTGLSLCLWPRLQGVEPQPAGLIDAVFYRLPRHTTPHPYQPSSTAQQQPPWLYSQAIRTAHITAHDSHKLSRDHRLTAYTYVPAGLAG